MAPLALGLTIGAYAGKFDAAMATFVTDPTPTADLARTWTKAGFGSANWGRYSNPAVDQALVRAAAATGGPAATLAAWQDAIRLLDADAPGISFNVKYSEVVMKALTVRLVDVYGWKGRRVTVVGHSRGGILAKVLSHRHPEMVEQVVTLGSPLADPYDVHPVTMAGVRVAQAWNFVRYGRTADIERRFLRDLAAEPKVPVTSIYSRSDGIVHWAACLRPDVRAVEVHGSHVGLGLNPEVYKVLARLLPWPARTS